MTKMLEIDSGGKRKAHDIIYYTLVEQQRLFKKRDSITAFEYIKCDFYPYG